MTTQSALSQAIREYCPGMDSETASEVAAQAISKTYKQDLAEGNSPLLLVAALDILERWTLKSPGRTIQITSHYAGAYIGGARIAYVTSPKTFRRQQDALVLLAGKIAELPVD